MGFSGTNIQGLVSPSSPADKTDYDTIWDSSMSAIDAHDHTENKGSRIGTAAITDNVITTTQLGPTAAGATSVAANAFTFAKIFSRVSHATAATEGNVLLTVPASDGAVYSTTSTTPTAVTTLTGTIVCSGRPILVGICNPVSLTGTSAYSVSGTGQGPRGQFIVKRNGTQVLGGYLGISATAAFTTVGDYGITVPHPMFTIDSPGAGTHTYAVYITAETGIVGSASTTTFLDAMSLFAWEL